MILQIQIKENNSLDWVDKQKGLEWLHSVKTNSQANTIQDLKSNKRNLQPILAQQRMTLADVGKIGLDAIIDSQRTTNTVESEQIELDLVSVAKIVKDFENPKIEREEDDGILFKDGDDKTPFMDSTLEKREEITGLETNPERKKQKALELSERLGLPIWLNSTEEEVGTLGSVRQRKAVGFYSRGEELVGRPGVTINLPNLLTVRDVVKAIFHEGVWHKEIRLFCKTGQERDYLMDHLYENSSEEFGARIFRGG